MLCKIVFKTDTDSTRSAASSERVETSIVWYLEVLFSLLKANDIPLVDDS